MSTARTFRRTASWSRLRRLLPPQARHLDGDLPAAVFHRARRLAEGRYAGAGRAVRQRRPLSAGHSTTRMQYRIDQFKLMDDFTLPKRFRVQPFVGIAGARLRRRAIAHGAVGLALRAALRVAQGQSAFAEPEIMARPLDHPKQPRFELRRWRTSFEILRAEVHDLMAGTQRDLGRVDWVDADRNGDVLWSAGGKLFRLAGPVAARHGDRCGAEARRRSQRHDIRGGRGAEDAHCAGLSRRIIGSISIQLRFK